MLYAVTEPFESKRKKSAILESTYVFWRYVYVAVIHYFLAVVTEVRHQPKHQTRTTRN